MIVKEIHNATRMLVVDIQEIQRDATMILRLVEVYKRKKEGRKKRINE
jgi:hypothetical protein